MNVILSVIVNIIFILFPSLLYIIYVANKQNLKQEVSTIILDISIISSLLLIILYNDYFSAQNIIIFPLLLLLFAFLNKRIFCSIIISVVSFEFIKLIYNFNNYVILLLFFGFFIIYFLTRKKDYKFIICSTIYSNINLFIAFYLKGEINYIAFFANIILFLLILILLRLWLKKAKEIIELQNILKEYKNEKKLRESLFKITHEIKNPLAVVKGYLSMIDIDNKEKSIKYINIIKSEVERTINLLVDFMQFSKIEIATTTIDFNILLDEIKTIVTPLFISNNILYEFKSEDNIMINADYNRLKQVIINVIKNSIEASNKKSKVYITCFVDNNNLNIIVKDKGTGMSEETLANLFTPFYTTKENGTGLGICLSKEIIEAHKGKIIYNSCKNKGTTAEIVLPIN